MLISVLPCTVASYLGCCRIVIRCNPYNELHSAFRYGSKYGVMNVNRKRCILSLSLEVAVPGQLACCLRGSGPEEYAAKHPATRKQIENERKKVLTCLVLILWDWRLWNRAPSRGLVWPSPCGKSPGGVEGGRLLADSLSYWP